jgi:hypothetical protein
MFDRATHHVLMAYLVSNVLMSYLKSGDGTQNVEEGGEGSRGVDLFVVVLINLAQVGPIP